LIILHDDLGRDMSRYLADRIERTPNVEVMRNTAVCELVGEKVLEAIEVEDTRSGERRRVDARALFVFIGAAPCTDWLEDQLALDSGGYVLTGEEAIEPGVSRDPSLLETSQPGVFAAGDVRSGSIKRVAAAVGEGAIAVRLAYEHFQDQM
jgi:thioredoxin reductase (NADPH)